jgi:hypothetical protein
MRINPDTGKPLYRPLRVFAFDPSRGVGASNFVTIDVPYEEQKPGPCGQHIMVIDYDGSNDRYYAPLDLDDPVVMVSNGLDPSESDPHFHQQMVYAVVSEAIRRFEFALGRPVKWRFRTGARDDPNRRKLRIFPHGMQAANAYYSRDLRALVFGYFQAVEADAGTNLPGQTVFTCLSHDIIVHETTHAILDSLREHFMDLTGPDTQAFHEAFADVIALFQHFTFKDALVDTIRRSGGLLHRRELRPVVPPSGGTAIQAERPAVNPLIGLAQQFGEAMGTRQALRSAIGSEPDPKALEKATEPHTRGSILVAAVFDAFFTAYLGRVQDLLALGRSAGWVAENQLHPDLAQRLAKEAAKTAAHFRNMCIRAMDYSPPLDMTFGDFLRALITADYELVPEDNHMYRAALIDAFRARGIVPEGVRSYSEQSLVWSRPDEEGNGGALRCPGLNFEARHSTAARQQQAQRNGVLLSQFGKAHAEALGLSPDRPVQAFSYHQLNRVGPDGQLKVQVVAELIQHQPVRLDGGTEVTLHGGSTVMFDADGLLRYAIHKDVSSPRRLERWRQFQAELQQRRSGAAYREWTPQTQMRFDLVHRGY